MRVINHNAVKRLRDQSKKAAPDISLEDLEPVIASNDGYLLTKDKRIICQFKAGDQPVLRNLLYLLSWFRDHMTEDTVLTKQMTDADLIDAINNMSEYPRGSDVKGVTKEEAFAIMSRMVAMPELESACLELQLGTSKMRKLLQELQKVGQARQPIPEKLVVQIAMLLRDTE